MWFEANLKQIMRALPDFPQARGGSTSFQMVHQQRRDVWVACMDHRQAICPTNPAAGSCGLPQTKPSRVRGSVAASRILPSQTDRSVLKMFARQSHTA